MNTKTEFDAWLNSRELEAEKRAENAQIRGLAFRLRRLTNMAWSLGNEYVTVKRTDLNTLLLAVKKEVR